MFLNSEDMSDDEDVGNSDIVVPLSLVASTPQIINGSSRGNGNRSALEAEDAPSGRSNQYNERLARARALNEQKRRVSSSSGARREMGAGEVGWDGRISQVRAKVWGG